jgi:hypothetical protein
MPTERLYLKPGVDARHAAATLRAVIQEASQVQAAINAEILLRNYFHWIEFAEPQLSTLTRDIELLTMLRTPTHWHIRTLALSVTTHAPVAARPVPLVSQEIEFQTAVLQDLVADLDARIGRAVEGEGHITVIDTNLLLEYERPDNVPWDEIIKRRPARIVVPLRVIEELDEKKYDRRPGLADRARRAASWLEGAVANAGAPKPLRDCATIEVLIDPGPRRRPPDADREILDDCHELHQLSGQPLTLVTGDTGMLLRAQAEAIAVVKMPETYARAAATQSAETPAPTD